MFKRFQIVLPLVCRNSYCGELRFLVLWFQVVHLPRKTWKLKRHCPWHPKRPTIPDDQVDATCAQMFMSSYNWPVLIRLFNNIRTAKNNRTDPSIFGIFIISWETPPFKQFFIKWFFRIQMNDPKASFKMIQKDPIFFDLQKWFVQATPPYQVGRFGGTRGPPPHLGQPSARNSACEATRGTWNWEQLLSAGTATNLSKESWEFWWKFVVWKKPGLSKLSSKQSLKILYVFFGGKGNRKLTFFVLLHQHGIWWQFVLDIFGPEDTRLRPQQFGQRIHDGPLGILWLQLHRHVGNCGRPDRQQLYRQGPLRDLCFKPGEGCPTRRQSGGVGRLRSNGGWEVGQKFGRQGGEFVGCVTVGSCGGSGGTSLTGSSRQSSGQPDCDAIIGLAQGPKESVCWNHSHFGRLFGQLQLLQNQTCPGELEQLLWRCHCVSCSSSRLRRQCMFSGEVRSDRPEKKVRWIPKK